MSISRFGTSHMYDRTIRNIGKQQAELASQMEHASAGKRVIAPATTLWPPRRPSVPHPSEPH